MTERDWSDVETFMLNAKQVKAYDFMIKKAKEMENKAKELHAEAQAYAYSCLKENEFKEYFAKFYGNFGLYPIKNLTSKEFEAAFSEYRQTVSDFHGDTVDREAIRDIIIGKRNYKVNVTNAIEKESAHDLRMILEGN